MSPAYRLVVGALVVWRVTHLFSAEDGPWDLLARFRGIVGHGFIGELLDCFQCLSLWTACPLALLLGEGWIEKGLLIPAFSGAAILLERMTSGPNAPRAPWYHEDPEAKDGLLREEAHPDSSGDADSARPE
jgi:hypothetical protein